MRILFDTSTELAAMRLALTLTRDHADTVLADEVRKERDQTAARHRYTEEDWRHGIYEALAEAAEEVGLTQEAADFRSHITN